MDGLGGGRAWAWLSVALMASWVVGCGPGVSSSDDDGGGDGGDSTGGDDVADDFGDSTGESEADGDTEDFDPDPIELCWEESYVRADGIDQAWTDGATILVAAGRDLLVIEGDEVTEHQPEGVRVLDMVTGRAPDDAWLLGDLEGGSTNGLWRWDGTDATLAVAAEEDETFLDLAVTDEGTPFVLTVPPDDDDCGGPFCDPEDHRLLRLVTDALEPVATPSGQFRELEIIGEEAWLVAPDQVVHASIADSDDADWVVDEVAFATVPTAIAASPEGEAWVAASDLWHYDGTDWAIALESTEDSRVTAVALDPGGAPWAIELTGDEARLVTGGARTEWVDAGPLAADRDVVVLDNGSVVAVGRDAGHLVERASGTAVGEGVERLYHRLEQGSFRGLRVGEGDALVGADTDGVQWRDDEGWHRLEHGSPYASFADAWGSPEGGIWIADADTGPLGVPIWRLEDGELAPATWLASDPDGNAILRGIWGRTQDDVWAVGFRGSVQGDDRAGVVAHWDGDAWSDATPEDISVDDDLRLVDGTAGALVVAGQRSVWHRLGDSWFDLAPPDASNLVSVVLTEDEELWALDMPTDGESRLLHFDGAWEDAEASVPPPGAVARLAASGPDDVWISWRAEQSDVVSLRHFDGEFWTAPDGPTDVLRIAAFVALPGELLLEGDGHLAHGTPCD